MLLHAQLQFDGHRRRRCSQFCRRARCRRRLLPQVSFQLVSIGFNWSVTVSSLCSLAAGFSTSVAVLCHELPHEVGDFALLLSQGMTVRCGINFNLKLSLITISSVFRTAIFYNVVSSVFAAFGLLAGLLLGSQEGLSSWLLSATVIKITITITISMMGRRMMAGLFQPGYDLGCRQWQMI